MDKKEFARERGGLQKEIFNALLAYQVYMPVWPTEEFVDVINRHRGFFQPVRYTLYCTWLMGLVKIFDKDSRTVSLINLINTTIKNKEELIQRESSENDFKTREIY
ncbi:hypothetical protein ACFLYB_00415 [Chloroflexota bacterium]